MNIHEEYFLVFEFMNIGLNYMNSKTKIPYAIFPVMHDVKFNLLIFAVKFRIKKARFFRNYRYLINIPNTNFNLPR